MILILAATADQFDRIKSGESNRIEIDIDTRNFCLSNGIDRARIMAGYPTKPRSFLVDLAAVLMDGDKKSFAVFRPICGQCARVARCEIFCDGVEYEKKQN